VLAHQHYIKYIDAPCSPVYLTSTVSHSTSHPIAHVILLPPREPPRTPANSFVIGPAVMNNKKFVWPTRVSCGWLFITAGPNKNQKLLAWVSPGGVAVRACCLFPTVNSTSYPHRVRRKLLSVAGVVLLPQDGSGCAQSVGPGRCLIILTLSHRRTGVAQANFCFD
jgi:hypothetical protein